MSVDNLFCRLFSGFGKVFKKNQTKSTGKSTDKSAQQIRRPVWNPSRASCLVQLGMVQNVLPTWALAQLAGCSLSQPSSSLGEHLF